MSFANISERTTSDLNASADINQLMENIREISGNGTLAPEATIQALYEYIQNMLCVVQCIQNHVIDDYAYAAGGTRAAMRELTCLNTSITTKKSDTRIAIDMNISMESTHNTTLVLFRVIGETETEIGSATQEGSVRPYGMKVLPYDSDSASTMSNVIIQYIDSPEVEVETLVTYKLKCYGDSGYGYFINRTLTDSDAAGCERATSNVRLTEMV